MLEKCVDITTADGTLNAYAYWPDEGGPFPAVIYYHDAAGAREAHADACRRIAAAGYYVLMPNLYYRQFRSIDIDVDRFTDPAYADKTTLMFSLSTNLSVSMVMRDTKAMLAFLETDAHVRRGKVGLLGYCMSGRFVYRGAGEFSDRVASAISMYGSRLVTDAPDSPHLLTDQIKAEMYFGFAEHEVYFSTAEAMKEVARCFETAGVQARIELYAAREHGFALRGRRVYHKTSSERHWVRIFSIFDRTLRR